MFREIPDGPGKFRRYSGWSRKVLEVFRKVLEGSGIFWKVLEGSRRFWKVLEYLGIF